MKDMNNMDEGYTAQMITIMTSGHDAIRADSYLCNREFCYFRNTYYSLLTRLMFKLRVLLLLTFLHWLEIRLYIVLSLSRVLFEEFTLSKRR